MRIVSVKKTAGGRSREIIDKKREKCRAKNGSLRNTTTDSKGATFDTSKHHASAPIRKERLSLRRVAICPKNSGHVRNSGVLFGIC